MTDLYFKEVPWEVPSDFMQKELKRKPTKKELQNIERSKEIIKQHPEMFTT
jgi:hypothetical protein